MKLHVYDIINNMVDELDRAKELLSDNEEARDSMLIADIESSLERVEELKERIDFALILAVYTGMENAKVDFEHECDNSEWRNKYLEIASQIELEYEGNFISSEWAYNEAFNIAKDMIENTF